MSTPPRFVLIWFLLAGLAMGTAAWSAAATSPASSEVTGVVRDTAGAPLAGATVQLRHAGRTIAGAGTEADGAFRVALGRHAAEIGEGDLTLEVQRLGYQPHERVVRAGDGPIEIVMTPAPLPLPGMFVDGGPVRCEGDDPEGVGRAVWRAAAARHPGGLDTLGAASYMRARTDTLDWPEARTESHGGAATGQRGSAPILRIGWSRRIDREGYAFPVRRTDRTGSYASWSYAPLEADFAPHFGTDQFGDGHYLQLVSEHVDGWTVRFCARDTARPHLEGRMEVDRDSIIRRVEWRFHTPEPDEGSAGWALFPPMGPEGNVPPLLPSESLTRRTLHDDRTVRRAHWFEGWILAPGDSVPFLPRRVDEVDVPDTPRR